MAVLIAVSFDGVCSSHISLGTTLKSLIPRHCTGIFSNSNFGGQKHTAKMLALLSFDMVFHQASRRDISVHGRLNGASRYMYACNEISVASWWLGLKHTYDLLDQNIAFSCSATALAFLLMWEHQPSTGNEVDDKRRGCFLFKVYPRRKSKPNGAVMIVDCKIFSTS
jgi:hypothetical protein